MGRPGWKWRRAIWLSSVVAGAVWPLRAGWAFVDTSSPIFISECRRTRLNMAQALVEWLGTHPTGTSDPDYLVVGDFNAYAAEGAVRYLVENGDMSFVDLVSRDVGPQAQDFIFDGRAGSLSNGFASASMVSQVARAEIWPINSDEPKTLDYEEHFNNLGCYEADKFRSSDHDPVSFALSFTEGAEAVPVRALGPRGARWAALGLGIAAFALWRRRREGRRGQWGNMERTTRAFVSFARLSVAVAILAATRAGGADDSLRPVRQIENDDGVIELTNAEHDDALDIDRAPAPKAVTPRRAPARKQARAALSPAAAPRVPGESSGSWWLLWSVAGVAGGAGTLLWRRAKRPPPWSVDHDAPERTSGPMAALSTLAPRERAVQGEPQWVSQLPHGRGARR